MCDLKGARMEKLTLSATETAKLLGISKETTLRLLDFGDIPAIRIGRNWKVPVRSLEEWLIERAKAEAKERSE